MKNLTVAVCVLFIIAGGTAMKSGEWMLGAMFFFSCGMCWLLQRSHEGWGEAIDLCRVGVGMNLETTERADAIARGYIGTLRGLKAWVDLYNHELTEDQRTGLYVLAIKPGDEYAKLIEERLQCHKSPRSTSEEGGLSADHPRRSSPNSVNASTATADAPSGSEPGR